MFQYLRRMHPRPPPRVQANGIMGPTRSYRAVFDSIVPQRFELVGEGQLELIGPGTYNPVTEPLIREPTRMNSQFASKSDRMKKEKGNSDDVKLWEGKYAGTQHLPKAPGSHGVQWPAGERTPPFFHVPFRPYPLESGAPKGRSPGLDQFYDLDSVGASPVALYGTMGVNVQRSPRRYIHLRVSPVPPRPRSSDPGSAGHLGPGSYTLERKGIGLKDPLRPSSCFMPNGNGKFRNVGLSYAEYLGVDLKVVAPTAGAGSRERRRGAMPSLSGALPKPG